MSTITTEDLLEETSKVASVVIIARRLIGEGKTVDLSNLEGKVRDLCEHAEAAGDAYTPEVEEAFNAIIQDLNKLNEEMSALLWDVEENDGEEMAKKAINAYSKDKGE